MFLLDTNVLSDLMTLRPSPEVAVWFSAQPEHLLLFPAAVSQAEILSGLAILPQGRRRTQLEMAARVMFLDDFDVRVLPFDTIAAENYADIYAQRRRAGRAVPTLT